MTRDHPGNSEPTPVEVRHNKDRSIRQTVYDDGSCTAEVLNPEGNAMLGLLAELLENPDVTDADLPTYDDPEYTSRVLEILSAAGIEDHLRHAFSRTGMLLTEETQPFWSPVALLNWHASFDEWLQINHREDRNEQLDAVNLVINWEFPGFHEVFDVTDDGHEFDEQIEEAFTSLVNIAAMLCLGHKDMAAWEILQCDLRGEEFLSLLSMVALLVIMRDPGIRTPGRDDVPEFAMAFAEPFNLDGPTLSFLNLAITSEHASMSQYAKSIAEAEAFEGRYWVEVVTMATAAVAGVFAAGSLET